MQWIAKLLLFTRRNYLNLGCEIPKLNEQNWNAWLSESQANEKLENLPPSCVFITHSPAKGYCDLQVTGANEDGEAIKQAILKYRPRLHLCGHIHHSFGKSDVIENTPTNNLGPKIYWFEI